VILIPGTIDVPYANSPDKHDFDQVDYNEKASVAGYFMAADELATTVFTEYFVDHYQKINQKMRKSKKI
jgi:hypothetical protein